MQSSVLIACTYVDVIHIILHPLTHAVPCSFSEAEIVSLFATYLTTVTVSLPLLQWVSHKGSHWRG